MIPNTDRALRMLSQRLMTTILPDLKTTYTMSDGMMLSLLINAVADEMAEGVNRRMQDIRDMQALMQQWQTHVADSSLIAAEPVSYSLQSVNALHDALTRELIALHEKSEVDRLDELNRAIWQYLRVQSERHRITAIP